MTGRSASFGRTAPATFGRAGELAADVRYYLQQDPRQLPSRYLYDELGSALFEAICRLPWYSITRAERRLLERFGGEILRRAAPGAIVELGCGSGEKLQILIEAAEERRRGLSVHLVDLSAAALERSRMTLAPYGEVQVATYQETYEEGLNTLARLGPSDEPLLVLFLGSNIGNFDPPGCEALLRGVRSRLRAGDGLLLGADLVKPRQVLELAYDDPLGVTAAFNRNLLVRVNRELEADFDLNAFSHRAVWNEAASRVEMHLVVDSDQAVHIAGAKLDLALSAGSSIWTESSYKFSLAALEQLLHGSGFRIAEQWVDGGDQFALTLAEVE